MLTGRWIGLLEGIENGSCEIVFEFLSELV
jgi:hypothetical protein